MRLRDRLARHLAVVDVEPGAQMRSSLSACFQPLSASASANGSVALLSAKVEVRATAPGMLVTQ